MPAHFNGLVGYTFDAINGNYSGYNDLELAYSSDYKNRMADEIFFKAGIPISRVRKTYLVTNTLILEENSCYLGTT